MAISETIDDLVVIAETEENLSKVKQPLHGE